MQASGVLLDTGVDGAGDILLNYDTKQAVISYSKISQGDNVTEIQGEKGRIRIEAVSLLKNITFIANDGSVENLSSEFDEHYMRHEIAHFIATINSESNESAVNTHALSQHVMSVLDEARLQLGVVYPNDLI